MDKFPLKTKTFDNMQEIRDILNRIKAGEVNLSQLSKETGISLEKINKWKQRGAEDIKLSDALILLKWLGMPDKSPPGQNLTNMIEANKILADVVKESVFNSSRLTLVICQLAGINTGEVDPALLVSPSGTSVFEDLRAQVKKGKTRKTGK